MTQTLETAYRSTLAVKMGASDTTMQVATAPTATAGRLKIDTGTTAERVDYTGVSGTTLTGLTRGLSKTAIPATAGTGSTHIAGTVVILVAMHDQLIDRLQPTTSKQIATTYATTAARDSALGANGVATQARVDIYVTATGLYYNYNLSTAQWEAVSTGTTTPNATSTVAGKVEIATTAETIAGTNTGGTGAPLTALPSDIAANIQSGTFVYAADAGANDTYVISLTPALTAYTAGQSIRFKANTANTGACTLNVNGLGAKNIKTISGATPADALIAANDTVSVTYDGTNFVMIKDNPIASTSKFKLCQFTYDISQVTGTTQVVTHNLGATPSMISFYMAFGTQNFSGGGYDGTNNYCSFLYTGGTGVTGNSATACVKFADATNTDVTTLAVTAISSTTFTVTSTKSGGGTGNLNITAFSQA